MVDLTKLGNLIDECRTIKIELDEINRKKSEIALEFDSKNEQILEIMDTIGTTTACANTARATVSEDEYPGFEDDEALVNWVAEDPKNRQGIYQRRLHKGNWQDLVNMTGGQVPGVSVFKKRKVVISKLPNT